LPYNGFCDVVEEFVRTERVPDFADLAPALARLFPTLAEQPAMRAALYASAPDATAPGFADRTAVFELLARTLTRIVGDRPRVVLLEGLQAADVWVEALQYVVRRLAAAPLVVVGTFRASAVDRRHPLAGLIRAMRSDPGYAHVELEPLPPAAHRRLLET